MIGCIMTLLKYDLTDTGHHIYMCPGRSHKELTWIWEHYTNKKYALQKSHPLGLAAVTEKVEIELAGPVSTKPLEPLKVTEWAGILAAMRCSRSVFSIQGACAVLFASMFFRSKDDDNMVFQTEPEEISGHTSGIKKALWCCEDKQILSAADKTVLLWDHTTMTEVKSLNFDVFSMGCIPKGMPDDNVWTICCFS